MRKFYILMVWLMLTNLGYAQTKQDVPIGKNLITGQEIRAVKYLFPGRVREFYPDPQNGVVGVIYRASQQQHSRRGSAHMGIYTLEPFTEKIGMRANFRETRLLRHPGMIFVTSGKTQRLSPATGQESWSLPLEVFRTDRLTNIGFAVSRTDDHKLYGIDLDTGKVLWEKNIGYDHGWNEARYLDDSTALITAGGIHRVDLKTGRGWSHRTATTARAYSEGTVPTTAGIEAGKVTGVYWSHEGSDLMSNIVSNALITQDVIYFADAERLTARDLNGTELWSYSFKPEKVSRSYMFEYGDRIQMINTGYGIMEDKRVIYGQPFIASFDKRTGENIYYLEGNEPVRDYHIENEGFYLLFDGRVVYYNTRYGTDMIEYVAQTDAPFIAFVSDRTMVKTDSVYYNPVLEHPENIYIVTKNGVVTTGPELNPLESIPFHRIYRIFTESDDHTILSRDGEMIVLDADKREIALFRASRSALLVGERLYDRDGNSILEIDLRQLTE